MSHIVIPSYAVTGGGYPDLTTVGPGGINAKPAPFTGPFTDVTPPNPVTANYTQDKVNFLASMIAQTAIVPGIRITRSVCSGILVFSSFYNCDAVFEDCSFDGLGPGSEEVLGYQGFTARRCHIYNCLDGVHCHNDGLFEDCLFENHYSFAISAGHEQNVYVGGDSTAAARNPPGESYQMVFRHNTIIASGGQAALSFLGDNGNINGILIENNKFTFGPDCWSGSHGGAANYSLNTIISLFQKLKSFTRVVVRNNVVDMNGIPATLAVFQDYGGGVPAYINGDGALSNITQWTNNKFVGNSGALTGKTWNQDNTVT